MLMMSLWLFRFILVFSDFSPRPTCSADLGHNQPQSCAVCFIVQADASRAPLHGHFPNLAWSLSDHGDTQRCTKWEEDRRHRTLWLLRSHFSRLDCTNDDLIMRPKKDPKQMYRHREHVKIDLATNFMFGEKPGVMHFLHVRYRSLLEFQYMYIHGIYMLYQVMSMKCISTVRPMSSCCAWTHPDLWMLRCGETAFVSFPFWALRKSSAARWMRQHLSILLAAKYQWRHGFLNCDLVIP